MTFCGVWLSKYGSAQYRTQSQSRFSAVCVAGERTEGGTLIERLPHDWLPLNIAVYSSLVSPSDYSVVPYWWWSLEDVFYPQQCGSIHRWTFHCYKYECVCSVYKGSCKHALLTTQNVTVGTAWIYYSLDVIPHTEFHYVYILVEMFPWLWTCDNGQQECMLENKKLDDCF